jgi:hypothetical protein
MGENSPEQVAFKLLETIASIERKTLNHLKPESLAGREVAQRAWVLDTYAECLQAVRGKRAVHVGSRPE